MDKKSSYKTLRFVIPRAGTEFMPAPRNEHSEQSAIMAVLSALLIIMGTCNQLTMDLDDPNEADEYYNYSDSKIEQHTKEIYDDK